MAQQIYKKMHFLTALPSSTVWVFNSSVRDVNGETAHTGDIVYTSEYPTPHFLGRVDNRRIVHQSATNTPNNTLQVWNSEIFLLLDWLPNHTPLFIHSGCKRVKWNTNSLVQSLNSAHRLQLLRRYVSKSTSVCVCVCVCVCVRERETFALTHDHWQ